MKLEYSVLTDAEVTGALDDLAYLRSRVFQDWPYLYDGDPQNEATYLRSYRDTPGAILVAARDGDRLVGAATGMPLERHQDVADMPLDCAGLDPATVFYCAESVLLPDWRGLGAGHAFFERREAHARALGRGYSAFCSVERPPDHPARPEAARDLTPFWRGRGYAPVEGVFAHLSWTDIGDDRPSEKRLQFWIKPL